MPEALVASFTGLAEAQVARATLASEGIQSRLAGEQLVGVAWHLSNAIGGVRLLVAPEDLERAKKLLEAPEGGFEWTGDASEVREETGNEAEPGPGDALARKAWQSALIGFIAAPPLLHLWSLWLVSRARPETERGRRDARRALILSSLVVAAAVAILAARLF